MCMTTVAARSLVRLGRLRVLVMLFDAVEMLRRCRVVFDGASVSSRQSLDRRRGNCKPVGLLYA